MPLGIFFVYGGVIFSMLTAVIYSIKGGAAIKQALAHPEDEDIDFPEPRNRRLIRWGMITYGSLFAARPR